MVLCLEQYFLVGSLFLALVQVPLQMALPSALHKYKWVFVTYVCVLKFNVPKINLNFFVPIVG